MESFMESIYALPAKVAPWSAHNFPNALPYQPLLGILEEIGELSEARKFDDKVDRIADTAIFLADYVHRNGIDLTRCPTGPLVSRNFVTMVPIFYLIQAAGHLSHAHLKAEQGIRGTPAEHQLAKETAIGELLVAMRTYCRVNAIDMDLAIDETWARVSQRDWRADPLQGQPAPAAVPADDQVRIWPAAAE